MIRLVINGALGRMGRCMIALASEDPRLQVVAEIDIDGPVRGSEALEHGPIDAVIDVSSDLGAQRAIEISRLHRAALLVATTALSERTRGLLDDAAASVAVMVASNLAPGVAVMKHLAALAATLLGPEYDLSLAEHHHAAKKDAPSGTALSIRDAIARASGRMIPSDQIFSGRGGDVIGEHTLRLAGPGEYLEIAHRATTRDLFARGALRAIEWLVEQPPGRYTIEQMLGFKGMQPLRHRDTEKTG